MNKIITFISDSHSKHNQISNHLPGGDILIHAGDFTSMGYIHEIRNFLKWFNNLNQYKYKIFISGNHDLNFENKPGEVADILSEYDNIIYLQDKSYVIDGIKIYGSPWQPEFMNWSFNLPRNGEELKAKWNLIPEDVDILITHGPAFGNLDRMDSGENIGCELLADRLNIIKPKIHTFGHIHSGYGYKNDGYTHYVNPSVLNENYYYRNKPITINWNSITNEVSF